MCSLGWQNRLYHVVFGNRHETLNILEADLSHKFSMSLIENHAETVFLRPAWCQQ
jgi:hypothetical protein